MALISNQNTKYQQKVKLSASQHTRLGVGLAGLSTRSTLLTTGPMLVPIAELDTCYITKQEHKLSIQIRDKITKNTKVNIVMEDILPSSQVVF